MATGFHLEPPPPFDFKEPDGWGKWRRWYLQFRDTAGLTGETETHQVNNFLYCLGEEANDVLASTNISERDSKKLYKVLEKFYKFLGVRHVIFERARFNQWNQLVQRNNRIIPFSRNYKYGDERRANSRLVGNWDPRSQQLQMDPKLTVQKAITTIRQKAAVVEQVKGLEMGRAHGRAGEVNC